ncbi:MAG: ABC transporter transmembrane domain-containing protein, partial [Phycicoccus sp.]
MRSRWTAWRVVRMAFRQARAGTALTVLMACIHQVCEAVTPVIVGLALDDAIAEGSVTGAAAWIGLLAGVYVVLSLCGNGAVPVGVRASTRAEHDVRQAVVARVLDARGVVEERPTGETLSLASSDAEEVGRGVNAVSAGLSGLAALLVATVALFVTSATLGAVALVSVLVVVFVAPLLARPLQRRSTAQQEAVALSAGTAVDMVEGLRVLGGLGAQSSAVARYRATSQLSRRARVRAGAAEAVFEGVTSTIGGFLVVAVAAVGALLAIDGDITPGELVAGVGLAQFLVGPVSRIASAGAMAATVRASARRIADLLDTPYAVRGVAAPTAAGAG